MTDGMERVAQALRGGRARRRRGRLLPRRPPRHVGRALRLLVALEFFGRASFAELGPGAGGRRRLRQLGVGAGARGIVLPNCPQHIVTFAVLRLGAVVVEHNRSRPARWSTSWDHGRRSRSCGTRPRARRTGGCGDGGVSRPHDGGAARSPCASIARARTSRAALTRHRAASVAAAGVTAAAADTRGRARPTCGDPVHERHDRWAQGAMLTHRNLHTNAAQGRAWVPGLDDGKEVIYACRCSMRTA